MDQTTFTAIYDDLVKALEASRLADALPSLKALSLGVEDVAFTQNVEVLSESYKLMLHYMSQGMEDPSREAIYRDFLKRAYELADVAYRELLLRDASSYYSSIWRTLQKLSKPCEFSQLSITEANGRHWFEVAWTSAIWNKENYEAAREKIFQPEANFQENAMLLSGVMLGCLQVYDSLRLKLLLDACLHENIFLRTRGVVGLALVLLKHSHRVERYPSLKAQLGLLCEESAFVSMMSALQMQFILTLETKTIEKNLREEILPEMLKHARNMKQDKKIGIEESEVLFSEQDFNPEWNADGAPSELGRKMRELAEMQQKGADVFIGSFKMLKQNFPFFNVAANWFCPFSEDHPEIAEVIRKYPFVKPLLDNGQFCDSDKFSLCLFLKTLPEVGLEPLKQQLEASLGDVQKVNVEKVQSVLLHVRYYVQDLYRFFQLCRQMRPADDPFRLHLLLTEVPAFQSLFDGEGKKRQLADFAFAEKHYPFALHFYQGLPEEAEVLQKIAFCYQASKDYKHAVEYYEKANLLKPDSVWTLRQLAFCYRVLGNYSASLEQYEAIEKFEPDDEKLLMRLSECYMHFKQYDKAFEKLFKANYFYPNNQTVVRAIAWCSLLTEKYDQAEQFYAKVLAEQPGTIDYYNAGHVAWLQKRIPEAISRYRKSLWADNKTYAQAHYFEDDQEVLLGHGLSEIDLHLMIDAINAESNQL